MGALHIPKILILGIILLWGSPLPFKGPIQTRTLPVYETNRFLFLHDNLSLSDRAFLCLIQPMNGEIVRTESSFDTIQGLTRPSNDRTPVTVKEDIHVGVLLLIRRYHLHDLTQRIIV